MTVFSYEAVFMIYMSTDQYVCVFDCSTVNNNMMKYYTLDLPDKYC